MRHPLNSNKGFTLIELLVVIAIISTLAVIVIVSLNQARVRARDSRRLGDFVKIMSALELYYDQYNNTYPIAYTSDEAANFATMIDLLRTTGFLGSYPFDPFGGPTCTTNTQCYQYLSNGDAGVPSSGSPVGCGAARAAYVMGVTFERDDVVPQVDGNCTFYGAGEPGAGIGISCDAMREYCTYRGM